MLDGGNDFVFLTDMSKVRSHEQPGRRVPTAVPGLGARRWMWLFAGAGLLGLGIYWYRQPPALPVPVLERAEGLDPMVRHHVEEIRALVQARPRDPQARATLGIALAANGLWSDARQAFLDTVRQSPGEPLAYLYAAVALQETSDPAGALREFESVTQRFPDFAPGWYRVGEMKLRSGDLESAQAAFQRLRELAPREWRGPAGLGEIRFRQGRSADAIPLLESALTMDPSAKPALYLLGQAYRAVGRTNEARVAIAAGSGEARQPMPDPWGDAAPGHVRALPDLLVQADGLATGGRPDLAVRMLRQMLPYHATNASLLNQYAIALNRSGQADQALPVLESLLKRDPGAIPPRITRVYSLNLLGRPAEGEAEAREAIRLAPGLAQAYLALADALLAAEKDTAAVEALMDAVKRDPGNAEIPIELGEIWWRNLRNPTAAVKYLEQAIELNPASVRAYLLLGSLQLERGDRTAARHAADILRRLAPDLPERRELEQRLSQP